MTQIAICKDNHNFESWLTVGKEYPIVSLNHKRTTLIVVDNSNRENPYLIGRFLIKEKSLAEKPMSTDWLSSKSEEIKKVVNNYFTKRFEAKLTSSKFPVVICVEEAYNLTVGKEYTLLFEDVDTKHITVINDCGSTISYYSHVFKIKQELNVVSLLCINAEMTKNLTVGERYQVVEMPQDPYYSQTHISIIDNRGVVGTYMGSRFKKEE